MANKLFAVILVVWAFSMTLSGQTTELIYQGSLQNGGTAATGVFDFEFVLFDSALGGAPIGPSNRRNGVAVANGIFAVSLDFGSNFPGASRFLEIRVRQSGGGGFTTLSPRQPLTSAPYSIRSLNSANADTAVSAINATNATNATNAVSAATAVNFTGPLGGDVTGSQNATTVARLQGRNVSNAVPTNGQVLKFDSATSQWRPDADNTGSGGGGGTITGVTAGTGLTGGGTTGSVTLGIANAGVTTAQLADGSVSTAKILDGNVTDPKIATVSGAKVTGTVANATNAATAVSFTGPLAGDVSGTQAATVIANNAVTNTKIADNAVTVAKIASGEVVKSINTLRDNVTLAGGNNISVTTAGNTLTISSTGGSGGGIQNQTTLQTGANFNIDGTGSAGTFNAGTQYNLGGSRILSNTGTDNLFAGANAGAVNASNANSFFGANAGASNSSGTGNSFFGNAAGQNTTSGGANSFFGREAGVNNTTGISNSFFGRSAGVNNTTASDNSFFGRDAGFSNTTGDSNSFFGRSAGLSNTDGVGNSFFGRSAGLSNTTGFSNAIFGVFAGFSNTTGGRNSFFGREAGFSNTTGSSNAFFGANAGFRNTIGGGNSFFGEEAGIGNTTGGSNAFFGVRAGNLNTTGDENAFFGSFAGFTSIGDRNAFFGNDAGTSNTTGSSNAFFGNDAGTANTTGSFNTLIGNTTNVASPNLTNATALGSGAIATASNRVQIGRITQDTVAIGAFGSPSTSTHVCIDNLGVFTSCSSSLRYKSNAAPLTTGLSLLKKLSPISFIWRDSGVRDIGLAAEEVERVDEQLIFRNAKGEVEGVKYDGINLVLINSIKEQQKQIDRQRVLIEDLRRIVCRNRSRSRVCRK